MGSKVRRRYPAKENARTAYRRALRARAWEVGSTPVELEFLAQDDEEAMAIWLSVQEMAENDAVKYPPHTLKRGAL